MITEVVVELTESGWLLVGLLVSTILPLVVGLVTTRLTAPGTKAVILLALAALIGFGQQLLDSHSNGTGFNLTDAIFAWVTFFLVGVGIHFGLWKPIGAAHAAQDVGNSAR